MKKGGGKKGEWKEGFGKKRGMGRRENGKKDLEKRENGKKGEWEEGGMERKDEWKKGVDGEGKEGRRDEITKMLYSVSSSFIIFWYIIYIFLLVLLIYLNESRPIYKFKQIKKIKVKASVLRRIKFLGDKAQMTRETATCPGTKAVDCKSRENLGNKSFIRTIQSVSQSTFVILTSIPLP